MDLPVDLEKWTFDTVVQIVFTHEYEPGQFDFKAALNSDVKDDKRHHEQLESIRRTTCAMANTGGGFILFGVRDHQYQVAEPLDRIVGIPVVGDHRRDFAHKIAALQPEVHFDAVPHLLKEDDAAERGVFVVYIPESDIRPHLVTPIGAFYKRDPGGNAVPMDVYEVRDQMILTLERLARLTLLRIRLFRVHRLCRTMLDYHPNYYRCFDRFDVTAFDSLLSEVCTILPLDYVFERLMQVAEDTTKVNAVLSHASVPSGEGLLVGVEYPLALQGTLWDIQRCCREAEERLEILYKPLPPGFRLRDFPSP